MACRHPGAGGDRRPADERALFLPLVVASDRRERGNLVVSHVHQTEIASSAVADSQ
jgi:hypothetical protein